MVGQCGQRRGMSWLHLKVAGRRPQIPVGRSRVRRLTTASTVTAPPGITWDPGPGMAME
jgi:hypothetical protein